MYAGSSVKYCVAGPYDCVTFAFNCGALLNVPGQKSTESCGNDGGLWFSASVGCKPATFTVKLGNGQSCTPQSTLTCTVP